MVSPPFAVLAALGVALTAINLSPFLRQQQSVVPSTSMTTTTQDTLTLDGAVAVEVELVPFQVMPLFAATAALFAAVAFIHLHHAAAAAAGAGNKPLSELVPFTLCGAAGVLLFFLFVLPADAVDDDVGSLSHALGRAAVDLLPASAAVVFFLGITLVIAHIRAGGEGGGGEVAGNRRVSVPVLLLKKIALGAAAALLGQISIALYLKYVPRTPTLPPPPPPVRVHRGSCFLLSASPPSQAVTRILSYSTCVPSCLWCIYSSSSASPTSPATPCGVMDPVLCAGSLLLRGGDDSGGSAKKDDKEEGATKEESWYEIMVLLCRVLIHPKVLIC